MYILCTHTHTTMWASCYCLRSSADGCRDGCLWSLVKILGKKETIAKLSALTSLPWCCCML